MTLPMIMTPEQMMEMAQAQASPPAQAQPATGVQGLLDRIAGRLFPQSDLIDPAAAQTAGRQGLIGMGMGLLEQAGPSPVPVSTGQALARAYAGASPQTNQMAALLTQGRKQRDQERQRQSILQRHAAPRGGALENPQQTAARLMRMLPEFAQIGDMEMVGKLTELLKSMGLGNNENSRGIVVQTKDGPKLVDPRTGREIAGWPGAPGQGPSRRLVTVRNPTTNAPEYAEYDPQTGSFRMTGRSPGTVRGPTDTQARMSAHLTMIQPALDILDAFGEAPDRFEAIVRQRGWGELLGNRQQLIDVASRQVADAFLRMTTGAAYNAEELANALIINTPRPGDAPGTLKYKKMVRANVLRALQTLSNRPVDAEPATVHLNEDGTVTIDGEPVDEAEGSDSSITTPSWRR